MCVMRGWEGEGLRIEVREESESEMIRSGLEARGGSRGGEDVLQAMMDFLEFGGENRGGISMPVTVTRGANKEGIAGPFMEF